MSALAEFDPEDTRAQPTRIREQARGLGRIGADLTGRQDSLSFVLRSLASSFSEVLHPVIAARMGEQFYAVQELVGAMLYAEQVTNAWADDVVAFRQQRVTLLDRWESAWRNGFWISRAPGYDNVEPEMRATLFDDARRQVLTELNAEADRAHATLDQAAQDRGRQLRDGPTTGNLLTLIDAGRFGGPGVAVLYPYLPVPGPSSGLPRNYWGMTAEQLVRATEDDPELAALLVAQRPDLTAGNPFEAALAHAVLIAAEDPDSSATYGAVSAARIAEIAALLADIPDADLALLSALFPAVVGNLDGMPFEHRIAANRINVAAAVDQARVERDSLLAEIDRSQPARFTDPALRYRLQDLDARIEQYELLLTEPTTDYGASGGPPWPDYRGRKVIYFDPGNDGAWAELVGTISADTDAVGVLIPGVGTDSADMFNKSNLATEFVAQAARDGEQLAMIVWAAGDFPDAVPAALSGSYAEELIHPMVDFSFALRQEVADRATGSHVPVTMIGHSYGGMTVSMATLAGLSADRLLFVNSAGMGTGEAGQFADYDVYAMASPGDLVPVLGPLVHAGAPSDLANVVPLATGTYRDGAALTGLSSHSGVFEESSTAWENMLAVLTGRPYRGLGCS